MRPTKAILQSTQSLIKDHIHRTPLLSSKWLTRKVGCQELYFKAENFQISGAYKTRGGCNAVYHTDNKIVCTNSSGNHGAGVALMAFKFNKQCFVVMGEGSSKCKIDAVKAYHGQVVFCPNTVKDRAETTVKVTQYNGAHMIDPYNDWDVIAGQATCAMEIYEDLKDLDYLIVPIGGGGLSSGSIFATRFFSPKTKIIGAEPELASDAYLSLKKGSIVPPMPPISIADGLRTGVGTIHTLLQGAITFPILQEGLDEIVTVSEEEIIKATFMMWRSLKIFVETSSAVVLAGMLKRQEKLQGKRVAAIISGGNVDMQVLMPYANVYDDCMA